MKDQALQAERIDFEIKAAINSYELLTGNYWTPNLHPDMSDAEIAHFEANAPREILDCPSEWEKVNGIAETQTYYGLEMLSC